MVEILFPCRLPRRCGSLGKSFLVCSVSPSANGFLGFAVFQALQEQELQGRICVMPVGGRALGAWGLSPAETHNCKFCQGPPYVTSPFGEMTGGIPGSFTLCLFKSTSLFPVPLFVMLASPTIGFILPFLLSVRLSCVWGAVFLVWRYKQSISCFFDSPIWNIKNHCHSQYRVLA